MNKSTEEKKRNCKECGKEFFLSREDRMFCNDGCRNAFNRKKGFGLFPEQKEGISLILKTIKKNYKILAYYYYPRDWDYDHVEYNDLVYGYDVHVSVHIDDLIAKGFVTNIFSSNCYEDDMRWKCCFDLSWVEFDNCECWIKMRPELLRFNEIHFAPTKKA